MSAVVTGLGPVSALGVGAKEFWSALLDGRSGIRRLSRFVPPPRASTVAAEVTAVAPSPASDLEPRPRAVELALIAAELAWDDAALEADPERIGVVVGTGLGNSDIVEDVALRAREGARISPVAAFRSFAHAAAVAVADRFDLRGPISTVSSGCNSGADALGTALDWIRLGRADVVLAGGTEAELTPSFWAAMTASRALAVSSTQAPERTSRPFDAARGGNVAGEGAAFIVLESERHAARRNARTVARLLGFAARAAGRRPPYDPFNPVVDTTPMLRAFRAGLADAGIPAADIVGVHANGSSSVAYDRLEAAAIRELRATVPVTSIKGGLGQTGAVTPVLQAIAAALGVAELVLPPTINCDTLGEGIELDLVRGAPRRVERGPVLLHAIGFGGAYCAASVIGPI